MSDYTGKARRYCALVQELGLDGPGAQALITRLTAPPFEAGIDASLALPCLLRGTGPQELPVASLKELERCFRRPVKARRLALGLQRISARCPEQMLTWLRLAPDRLCRLARVLGVVADDEALRKAQRHALFLVDPSEGWTLEGLVRVWYPLRPPQLVCDCVEGQVNLERLSHVRQSLPRWLDLARLELVFHYLGGTRA